MKFDSIELAALTSPSGDKFSVSDLESAYGFCKSLALGHYENFPVASVLLPKSKRHHIFAIYSFARIADDISDEIPNSEKDIKLNLLDDLLKNLRDYQDSDSNNPILYALSNTIKELNINDKSFERLIHAFKFDADFKQADSIDDLYNYCSYSANPIGELVLTVFEQNTKQNIKLSDDICTALQLTNFWQDFSRDLKINRCFIPKNLLAKYGLTKENLERQENSAKFIECMEELYTITDELFDRGAKLIKALKPLRLKLEIAVTLEGGRTVLNRSKELGSQLLTTRPHISKLDYVSILYKSFKYLWM